MDIDELNSALVATASANRIELKEGLQIESIRETALGEGVMVGCINVRMKMVHPFLLNIIMAMI